MILPTQPLDHHPLRQTTLTTQPDGTPISELRYTAYGEERYASGEPPTGYRYTGQLSKLDTTGLYYYGARWYDPAIMTFARADTLIPDPSNPLDWNRYLYSRVNPVRYTDCQFMDVNAPPLFGNTAPAICGRDAPLGERMQKQSGENFKVRSASSAPPPGASCGLGSGRRGRGG